MIVYLIFLTILIIFYFSRRVNKLETFNNYKSITITPNKGVYNPMIILSNKNIISRYINSTIANYLPVIPKIINVNNYDILKQYKNKIIISTLYDFLKYSETNKHDMKFVMHLFQQKLTVISKSNKYKNISDLSGKDLYIYSKDSSEYYVISKIQQFYNFNIKILPKKYRFIGYSDLVKILSGKIENIVFFTNHPNIDLIRLIKKHDYSILSIDNINYNVLSNTLTNFEKNTIDSNQYYKHRTDMIDTIVNPIVLLSDKNIDSSQIFNIINFIYRNFMLIKKTNNPYILDIIKYFNLSKIFSSDTNLYEVHDGVEQFYREFGFQSGIDSNICRKRISIKNCEEDNIKLNPYRFH
jgi:TRAP-type uncharacterized transport system substrate-binding protein